MDLNETYARLGEYIKSRPAETYGQIASALGLSRATIARIARLQGIKRRPGRRSSALEAAVAAMDTTSPQPDSGSACGTAAPVQEPDGTAQDGGPAETAVL
jgi:hypothetical protein